MCSCATSSGTIVVILLGREGHCLPRCPPCWHPGDRPVLRSHPTAVGLRLARGSIGPGANRCSSASHHPVCRYAARSRADRCQVARPIGRFTIHRGVHRLPAWGPASHPPWRAPCPLRNPGCRSEPLESITKRNAPGSASTAAWAVIRRSPPKFFPNSMPTRNSSAGVWRFTFAASSLFASTRRNRLAIDALALPCVLWSARSLSCPHRCLHWDFAAVETWPSRACPMGVSNLHWRKSEGWTRIASSKLLATPSPTTLCKARRYPRRKSQSNRRNRHPLGRLATSSLMTLRLPQMRRPDSCLPAPQHAAPGLTTLRALRATSAVNY